MQFRKVGRHLSLSMHSYGAWLLFALLAVYCYIAFSYPRRTTLQIGHPEGALTRGPMLSEGVAEQSTERLHAPNAVLCRTIIPKMSLAHFVAADISAKVLASVGPGWTMGGFRSLISNLSV